MFKGCNFYQYARWFEILTENITFFNTKPLSNLNCLLAIELAECPDKMGVGINGLGVKISNLLQCSGSEVLAVASKYVYCIGESVERMKMSSILMIFFF